MERLQRAYSRQAEILGFGELSAFGAEVVGRIFKRFDADDDGALSLWELNAWLVALGSPAIPDQKDYDEFLAERGLLTDAQGHVTLEGMVAYYEQFGSLASDARRLGVGALVERLKGKVEFNVLYDTPALEMGWALLEPHAMANTALKKVLRLLSSQDSTLIEVHLCCSVHLFTCIEELKFLCP